MAWFIYAWTMDTVLMLPHLVNPRRAPATMRQIAGRLKATSDLLTRRSSRSCPSR